MTLHTDDLDNRLTTNRELAHSCASQLRYIRSSLGLLDTGDASGAILRALKGARKVDLWAIVDMLQAIKRETRAIIEAGKQIQDSKPRNAWEGG